MKTRKMISLLCAIAMALTLVLPAGVAGASLAGNGELTGQERGPQYVYKTEYLPVQFNTVRALAGNQLSGGVKLENSGDSINFSTAGGEAMTVQASISLPPPFNFVSFGASAGQVATSSVGDYSKTLGNLPAGFYVLYLNKVYKVSPYVTYVKRAGAEYTEWEIDRVGCVSEYYSADPELVRVVS